MILDKNILTKNQENYDNIYKNMQCFLQYPADWVIRFHNMFLKKNIPSGRILDYGCGSGNNSVFFVEKGYEVYGVDVVESVVPQIKAVLKDKYADDKFLIVPPDCSSLPFKDGFFDFIISNQVLYYLASETHIRKVCKELSRCLRPGGVVFFTMMGAKNYYITHKATQIHKENVYEININDKKSRLHGRNDIIYVVRDRDELKNLFSEFECLSIGYFDQSMFDMVSNFHWIFVGRKK